MPDTPESRGIQGWSVHSGDSYWIGKEAQEFVPEAGKSCVLCRRRHLTTINFKELVEIFLKKVMILVLWILSVTQLRRDKLEAKDIAAKVDAMIVIGGKHSSIQRKLYEICCKECAHTCLIQTLDDLHLGTTQSCPPGGYYSRTSTLNKLIEEVQNYVRINFEQMLEESLKTIHAGEVVEGTVIDVKPEEVILNIGYKSDGILTRNEYTNDPGVDMTVVVKTGDKMEVQGT